MVRVGSRNVRGGDLGIFMHCTEMVICLWGGEWVFGRGFGGCFLVLWCGIGGDGGV